MFDLVFGYPISVETANKNETDSFMSILTSIASEFGKENEFNPKFIFNDPATIMVIDGEKVICKAQDEPFDEEKGVLMCLAKYCGITYTDIKRWCDEAIKPSPKKKKVLEKHS